MATTDLKTEVGEILKRYGQDVRTMIDDQAEEVAKIGSQTLKARSPIRSGNYAKTWTYKRQKSGRWYIYNSKNYRLTHLLEKGHATVRKSGKYGSKARTKEIPHISTVEKQVIELFEARIKSAIEYQQ